MKNWIDWSNMVDLHDKGGIYQFLFLFFWNGFKWWCLVSFKDDNFLIFHFENFSWMIFFVDFLLPCGVKLKVCQCGLLLLKDHLLFLQYMLGKKLFWVKFLTLKKPQNTDRTMSSTNEKTGDVMLALLTLGNWSWTIEILLIISVNTLRNHSTTTIAQASQIPSANSHPLHHDGFLAELSLQISVIIIHELTNRNCCRRMNLLWLRK